MYQKYADKNLSFPKDSVLHFPSRNIFVYAYHVDHKLLNVLDKIKKITGCCKKNKYFSGSRELESQEQHRCCKIELREKNNRRYIEIQIIRVRSKLLKSAKLVLSISVPFPCFRCKDNAASVMIDHL